MNTLAVLLAGSLLFNLLLLIRVQRLKKDVRGIKEGIQLSKEELEQLKTRIGRIKKLG